MSPPLDVSSPPDGATRPFALRVEGWRGINQSFAQTNQQQLLALLDIPGLVLTHRDMPFAMAHWTREGHPPGFPAAAQARIDAIPSPEDDVPDCVYRICSPFRAPAPGLRTLSFMVTELGLLAGSFAADAGPHARFTEGGNAIVTPSAWSRARLVEAGFPAERIHIIPHGVDTALFHPLTPAERLLARGACNIASGEFVFLSIATPLWTKGVDLILRGFALLRAAGRPVRLLLKDQRDIYGLAAEDVIARVAAGCPELLQPEVRAAITLVRENMPRERLRLLYGMADCYLAPYRAEGFSHPVLEAIACGVPPIVTAGGATEEFCDDDIARRVPGTLETLAQPDGMTPGRYIEPDFFELVATMDAVGGGNGVDPARFAAARQRVLARFDWHRVAEQLATLAAGRPMRAQPASPHAVRPLGQRDILGLLGLLRPRAMAAQGKRRVGNACDGGYVVPESALACDGVLSIGIGGDVSFDLVFAEHGAQVLQIDCTVDGPPAAHGNFHFHKLGWGPRDAGEMRDLAALRALLAALAPRSCLLKFDIEGGEYEVLPELAPDALADFDVIVCELHDLHRLAEEAFHARAAAAIARLTARHVPVHLHANNYQGMTLLHGVPVPQVLEVTLLRDDLDSFPSLAGEPIPGPLDRPNHPLLPDLCLTPF